MDCIALLTSAFAPQSPAPCPYTHTCSTQQQCHFISHHHGLLPLASHHSLSSFLRPPTSSPFLYRPPPASSLHFPPDINLSTCTIMSVYFWVGFFIFSCTDLSALFTPVLYSHSHHFTISDFFLTVFNVQSQCRRTMILINIT